MPSDKENRKPNENNQSGFQDNKKNRTRKSNENGKGVLQQPSTSQGNLIKPTGDLSNVPDRSNGDVRRAAPVAPTKPTQGSKPSKKRESNPTNCSFDAAAFDLEERDDKEDRDQRKHRSKANAEDSIAELESLTGIKLNNVPSALCLRPEFESGRGGERIALLTNFFRLKLKGNDVYQYDVAFLKPDESAAVEPEQEVGRKFKRITKRMNQTLLKRFVDTTGKDLFRGKSFAFDNDRILITNKPLAAIPEEGQIFRFEMLETRNDEITRQGYLIRIKSTVSLSINFESTSRLPKDKGNYRAMLQVLDIICKTHAFQNNIIYGSKIFFPAERLRRTEMLIKERQTPFELAFGYHQSTQFCQGGPMQNIDRASAVLFRGGPLIDRLVELLGPHILKKPIDGKDRELMKEFNLIRFTTNYRGFPSSHMIKGFTSTNCDSTHFNIGGSPTSITAYFQEHYAIRLKYRHLPCIEYGQGKHVPIELCEVAPDQRYQRKLRDELIKIVSTHATSQTPAARSEGTVISAKSIANAGVLEPFGIQLMPTQVKVESRCLAAPLLKYNNKPEFSPPVPGDWNMNDKKFLTPVALSRWAVICYGTRKIEPSTAVEFVKRLQRSGEMLGMRIENPSAKYEYADNAGIDKLLQKLAPKNLQLIVVFMVDSGECYTTIKSLGDQKLGVPTQIILDKHYNTRFDRADRKQKLFDPSFLFNLLLKINVKIGGANLKLWDGNRCCILGDKTMVVGIDVNHPSPGENSSSIAAVVGSLDSDYSHYRTEIRVNKSREELVQVDQMIVPILEAYKLARGFYPEHIIVYRDGVSEGQFAYVLQSEILPLRKVIDKLGPRPPKLTYLVVQKRHNARFFPADRLNATRSGNILPGSVIDTEICHYNWFDFYLCSQNSFLGTARPGKYTVLWNNSKANADDIQLATYYLCYLFARSTKSIADPAPARYAHHAAARGKVYLKEAMKNSPDKFNIVTGTSDKDFNTAVGISAKLKNILFFI